MNNTSTNLTLNDLRVTTTGTSAFLQCDPTADDAWTTLRPLESPDGQLIVCVGTEAAHNWYPLQEILEGLAADDFAFSLTAPLPPPLTPNWGDLSPDAIAFAVRGSLGVSVADMRTAAGGDDAYMSAQSACMAAGLIPHKAGAVKPIWDAIIAKRHEAIKHASTKLYVEPSKTKDPALADTAAIVYNVPRTLSADQLESLKRRLAVRDTPRIKWPFATMNDGQSVFIEAKLAAKGQRAAHAYGASAGVVFVTHRLNNGDLEVIRTHTKKGS